MNSSHLAAGQLCDHAPGFAQTGCLLKTAAGQLQSCTLPAGGEAGCSTRAIRQLCCGLPFWCYCLLGVSWCPGRSLLLLVGCTSIAMPGRWWPTPQCGSDGFQI